MADNTVLNLGTGGDTIASDDISGAKHQRIKVTLGDDGTAVDQIGGSGVNGTNTARVTIATDDTLVGKLAIKAGAANIAMGQVSVDATSTGIEIVAARAARRTVTIVNHGTTQVFLKGGSVASTTGVLLVGTVGASATFESVSQIKGITASGTVTVSYVEEYD